jgi:hypothetical protein
MIGIRIASGAEGNGAFTEVTQETAGYLFQFLREVSPSQRFDPEAKKIGYRNT